MSNYQVEPIDKPAALTKEAIKSLRNAAGPGPVAPAADADLARRRHRAVAARGHGRHARLPLAEPRGRLRRADHDRRPRRRSSSRTASLPDRRGLPGLLPGGPRVRHPASTPASSGSLPGEDTTGDGDARSTSGRSTSAARTSAASRTRASRTSGSSAPATARATTGSGSRPTAPQYGPAPRGMDRFAISVDGDGRADHQHRQDHPRPAARSRSASPGSSRRERRPAASDAVTRPAHRGDR